ncbi:MAG: hypothetical protein U1A77_04840 [Pirellulales bacterium]
MNSPSPKPRPSRSAPRPATGPTASSAARSLRRAAQTAYSASAQQDSPPPLPPPVSVIAQIPNFAKPRSSTSTPQSTTPAPSTAGQLDDPYLTLSKAARGVDSLAQTRHATIQSLANSAESQSTPPFNSQPTTADFTPRPADSPPQPTSTAPAHPVARDDKERWVERLPEWQRLAIQAVVMIAAAILVVAGFAWWRQTNETTAEPISRQAMKELEIDEGTNVDDLSVDDGQDSSESRGSLARKPPRASDWSDRDSGGTRSAPSTAANQAGGESADAAYSSNYPIARDGVSAPPTIEDHTPGSPAGSVPNSPPATNPQQTLEGGSPTINAPEQARYPSTDPRRFQFGGLNPSGAGGNAAARTPTQSPTAPGGVTQPPSETARLGEITPLRSGNLR